MSEHLCPNCHKIAFVWALDEEKSINTLWYCSLCKYEAEENESLEGLCSFCKTEGCMLMKDDKTYFKFCTKCNKRESTNPW